MILKDFHDLVGLSLVYETIEQKRNELDSLRFDRNEAKTLETYAEATKLYVDCLQLAVLDDRAAAEARIFALPT